MAAGPSVPSLQGMCLALWGARGVSPHQTGINCDLVEWRLGLREAGESNPTIKVGLWLHAKQGLEMCFRFICIELFYSTV